MKFESGQFTRGPRSPGERKVDEYVERIKSGEPFEKIVEGLPQSFRAAIDRKLNAQTGEKNDFATFSQKHGHTAGGEYWWYQYRNRSAEQLKQSGHFEWGKDRIYFDISLQDAVRLRDTVMQVAAREKIPVAFKFLDEKAMAPSHLDGTETRFVVNFASLEDAERFYRALAASPEYTSLAPDRNLDYQGVRIDKLAEYAGGFREQRAALARIVSGNKNGADQWEWKNERGETKTISMDQFLSFKQQKDKLDDEYAVLSKRWNGLARPSAKSE